MKPNQTRHNQKVVRLMIRLAQCDDDDDDDHRHRPTMAVIDTFHSFPTLITPSTSTLDVLAFKQIKIENEIKTTLNTAVDNVEWWAWWW